MIKSLFLIAGMLTLAFGGAQKSKQKILVSTGDKNINVSVEVQKDDSGENMVLNLNGGSVELDPSTLEVGDSQTYMLDNGEEVTITRLEQGYTLNVGGEDINIFTHQGDGAFTWISEDGGLHEFSHDAEHVFIGEGAHGAHGAFIISEGDGDVDSDVFIPRRGSSDAVTISGIEGLDEDLKQRITDALRDAGIEKDIRFMESIHLHDGGVKVLKLNGKDKRKVRVIKESKSPKKY